MSYLKDNVDWIVPSLLALFAAVFAAWSSISSHRSAREARLSGEAARRAADAAERSADADQYQASILREDRGRQEREIRRRPWLFEPLGETKGRIVNTGPTVYNVRISRPLLVRTQFTNGATVEESGSVGLSWTRAWNASEFSVTVKWYASPDEVSGEFSQNLAL